MWDILIIKNIKSVLLSSFAYTCTINWFCVHLYCKLVLCAPCTENWFCVHVYCKHADRKITPIEIRSKRNVQGTDITSKKNVQGTNITQVSIFEYMYTQGMYNDCHFQNLWIWNYKIHKSELMTKLLSVNFKF